jgi:hypothetical protein
VCGVPRCSALTGCAKFFQLVKILNGTAPGDLPVELSDQSGADHQSENRQGARDRNSPDPTRPGRRGDRMNEAVSYVGTFETCANEQVRLRSNTGPVTCIAKGPG